MFAGGEQLLCLFKEMGVSMTRQELDDPSLRTKRDCYWSKIATIFNDESAHNYDHIDTGQELVDSFAGDTCSPKFRCYFPVHRLFANYTSLRSQYETGQAYRNWKSSGQNDGINFYPNFERYQPLHVMLHTFIHELGLSGFALSAMDEDYAYCSSKSIETLIGGEVPTATQSPKSFRANLVNLRGEKKKVKISKQQDSQKEMTQMIREKIIKVDEGLEKKQRELEKKQREAQLQDAWSWELKSSRCKRKLKAELKAISDDDSDVEEIKDQLKMWSKIHKEAKTKVLELEKQQQVPMVPIDLE